MAVISLGKNISALRAQRQLNNSSASLARNYERLSSGMRINHAVDDAGGLAVASKLSNNARVYGQAIRNANDGISALNIAEGAVSQLSDILIRVKEMAESAANGTLNLSQRRSLDTEAKALTDEFNRILSGTKFNRNRLIDGTLENFGVQLGFGSDGRISLGLGDGLERTVGTGNGVLSSGTFDNGNTRGQATGDFNGDGAMDIFQVSTGGAFVQLGNGDGTFQASGMAILLSGGSFNGAAVADMNNDGNMDLIATDAVGVMQVAMGNGNGTFATPASYAKGTATAIVNPVIADINNDGFNDIVTVDTNSTVGVFLNNGAGGFTAGSTFAAGTTISDLQIGDLNNDGNLDIATLSTADSKLNILLGTGTGSFGAKTSSSSGASSTELVLGDFSHDGVLDIAIGGGGGIFLALGNGDGTMQSLTQISTAKANEMAAADLNGDGNLDLVAGYGTTSALNTILGNGDGSFGSTLSINAAGFTVAYGLTIADFTGDGVVDVLTSNNTTGFRLLASDTTTTNTSQRYNLTTSEEALATLDLVNEALNSVTNELGNIGSASSRLRSALATVTHARENYLSAASRITDVDIAEESASLLVNQIRQQAAAAIMAQANVNPKLALALLGAQ